MFNLETDEVIRFERNKNSFINEKKISDNLNLVLTNTIFYSFLIQYKNYMLGEKKLFNWHYKFHLSCLIKIIEKIIVAKCS